MNQKANQRSRSKNQVVAAPARELSLEYDPLDPSFNALHRAGMVGMTLQIEALKERNRKLSEEDAVPVPHQEWIGDGRGFRVSFTSESFETVLQERYLGKTLMKDKPAKKNRGNAESDSPQEVPKPMLVPRLRYLEDLGADSKLQEHIRSSYRNSFFSIYLERESFFAVTAEKKRLMKRINDLWTAIALDGATDIQKSSRPNIVGNDLKGTPLQEGGKNALLLHFWPLASWFFTPRFLKYDKKKKQILDDWLPPVLVVPDVSHVEDFVTFVKTSYSRPLQTQISTPLEAALAFYVSPLIARGQTITREIQSELNRTVRGASVFAYLRRGKQLEVGGVFSEAYTDELLREYMELRNQNLKSPPYRALRVENLLAGRVWHDGFNRLADHWPLELFVPVKVKVKGKEGAYELQPKAHELARDLAADFNYFAEMEDEMSDAEQSVPTLIDELVTNYLHWRVYNKGQAQFDKKEMNAIFLKVRESQRLSEAEEKDRARYNDKFNKGVNQEFVDFRSATDRQRFAELFISRLFEAGFHTTPEEREMLRPFYERDQWESGRWLVLMAISAACAPHRTKA